MHKYRASSKYKRTIDIVIKEQGISKMGGVLKSMLTLNEAIIDVKEG